MYMEQIPDDMFYTDLANRVMARLSLQEKKRARRNAVFFSASCMLFGLGTFLSWGYLQYALTSSGFMQFFSLLFSDGGMMLAHFKDYAWSLAESLPAANIALFLACVLACGTSFVFIVRTIKKIRYGTHTATKQYA